MAKIKVLKMVGGRLTTEEQGVAIRNGVIRILNNSLENVIIDFSGVKLMLPIIVNNAVAKLFKRLPESTVSSRVKVIGLPEDARKSLRMYLKDLNIESFEGKY